MLLKESNNRATTTWSNCKHHKLQKKTLNPKPFWGKGATLTLNLSFKEEFEYGIV
jgi:hypothetical protein